MEEGVADLFSVEVLALLVVEAEHLVYLLARDLLVQDHRHLVTRRLLEDRSDPLLLADDVDEEVADFAVVPAP